MMAINTVAAGGGSILHFDGARFRVGPDSAGADPGPRLLPPRRAADRDRRQRDARQDPARAFSRHFRPDGDQPLDADVVRAKFAALAERGRAATGQRRDPRDIAEGFLRIAVANMANAIKQVSVQKGYDVDRLRAACFGGAGGQHACLVADALGMESVFIHPLAGVLSAYGMGLADQTVMREQAVEVPLDAGAWARSPRSPSAGAAGDARRWRRRAPSPRASRRTGRCICATPAPTAALAVPLRAMPDDRAPISPRRTARASASPRPGAP